MSHAPTRKLSGNFRDVGDVLKTGMSKTGPLQIMNRPAKPNPDSISSGRHSDDRSDYRDAAIEARESPDPQSPNLEQLNIAQLRARLEQEIAAHAATRQARDSVRRALIDARRQFVANRRDMEQRVAQRMYELDLVMSRFEAALRGSNVVVFTQDRDLRYTSLSKPLFGRDTADILGRNDAEILPPDKAAEMVALKHEMLLKDQPMDIEIRVDSGSGIYWYDLHIEPLRDVGGHIIGLTGAAVDMTERRESEAHLRLLMRELTHRSKNLLAVIQAMARQTARQGGTITNFLERFSARLQALARSHDLLVQESWHGVSLQGLVRSQLGHYLDRDHPQVTMEGPDLQLRPEAAQGLGLALHELATNAAKYGALSRLRGRVAICWHVLPSEQGAGLELIWRESKGPAVGAPKRRGFGSLVIEHNLARALDAEVELNFLPEGLQCRVTVPAAQFQLYFHPASHSHSSSGQFSPAAY